MALTSKTGLLEGTRKAVVPSVKPPVKVEFPNITRPAPFALRPFAGIYNPFPYGCSVLCNHPADYEAKDVVRRAKDAWASEGRALLLPEELAAIRANLLHSCYRDGMDAADAVPEELFRRYTDTDSRPLTPAPTLASAPGRRRRCVTPDPAGGGPGTARPLLLLDLRRSRSQDALAWRAANPSPPPPPVHPHIRRTATRRRLPLAVLSPQGDHTDEESSIDKSASQRLQQQVMHGVKALSSSEVSNLATDTTACSGDEEVPKRRGKRRKRGKKLARDAAREREEEFQGLPEPGETQVSTLDLDSHNPSARPSLAAAAQDDADPEHLQLSGSSAAAEPTFLDAGTLTHLQRQLDQEVLDCELNHKKHLILKEALRMMQSRRGSNISEEMKQLKKELNLLPNNSDLLLGVPRNFSRQSARFELPMDSRALTTMAPMDYLEKHVSISSGSLLLYNRVFNRHKEELDEDEVDRKIMGKNVAAALGEVMGRTLGDGEVQLLRGLVGWADEALLRFRSWAGLCALCERLLGTPQDRCLELERADLEPLPRRLAALRPCLDPRLVHILTTIRDA